MCHFVDRDCCTWWRTKLRGRRDGERSAIRTDYCVSHNGSAVTGTRVSEEQKPACSVLPVTQFLLPYQTSHRRVKCCQSSRSSKRTERRNEIASWSSSPVFAQQCAKPYTSVGIVCARTSVRHSSPITHPFFGATANFCLLSSPTTFASSISSYKQFEAD